MSRPVNQSRNAHQPGSGVCDGETARPDGAAAAAGAAPARRPRARTTPETPTAKIDRRGRYLDTSLVSFPRPRAFDDERS